MFNYFVIIIQKKKKEKEKGYVLINAKVSNR